MRWLPKWYNFPTLMIKRGWLDCWKESGTSQRSHLCRSGTLTFCLVVCVTAVAVNISSPLHSMIKSARFTQSQVVGCFSQGAPRCLECQYTYADRNWEPVAGWTFRWYISPWDGMERTLDPRKPDLTYYSSTGGSLSRIWISTTFNLMTIELDYTNVCAPRV